MASIIHKGQWTLTDDAAKKLEAEGLIEACSPDVNHDGLIEADKPIYHPVNDVHGMTIATWINRAHQETE